MNGGIPPFILENVMLDHELIIKIIKPDFDAGLLFWMPREKSLFKEEFRWKSWNDRYAHKEALVNINNGGYKQGEIYSKPHKAHRVMWYIETKEIPLIVDHINGIRTDNRLENLRNVSVMENARNTCLNTRNKSGVIGVSYDNTYNKWVARIVVEGKSIFLGYFENFEEAVETRKLHEIKYGFHKNHGRNKYE